MKRLYRSDTNKVFAGICGGLGEYFKVDPVIIRVLYLIFTFATGFFPGVFVYLIAYFIIPEHSDDEVIHVKARPSQNTEAPKEPASTTPETPHERD